MLVTYSDITGIKVYELHGVAWTVKFYFLFIARTSTSKHAERRDKFLVSVQSRKLTTKNDQGSTAYNGKKYNTFLPYFVCINIRENLNRVIRMIHASLLFIVQRKWMLVIKGLFLYFIPLLIHSHANIESGDAGRGVQRGRCEAKGGTCANCLSSKDLQRLVVTVLWSVSLSRCVTPRIVGVCWHRRVKWVSCVLFVFGMNKIFQYIYLKRIRNFNRGN